MTISKDLFPKHIGNYRIEKSLFEDHLGVLYQALNEKTPQTFWLKLFDNSLLNDAILSQRFIEGITYLQQFQHPRMLPIREVQKTPQDGLFVVIEPSKGNRLDLLLSSVGKNLNGPIFPLISQLLEIVKALHQSSLILGDLRSSLLFVSFSSDSPRLDLLNLGHGWWWNENLRLGGGFSEDSQYYLAPEQLSGEPWDHRVDIYACGIILIELLFAKPIHSISLKRFFDTHHHPKIPRILEQLPSNFDKKSAEKVLSGALALHPDERFSSAHDLEVAVLEFLEASSDPFSQMDRSSTFLPTEQHLDGLEPTDKTTVGPTERNFGSHDSLDSVIAAQETNSSEEWLGSDNLDFGEATTIQPMPDIDFNDDTPQATERMELDEALQSLNYQEYLKKQEEEALLAAIREDSEDKTRPGFAPTLGKLPDLGPPPAPSMPAGLATGNDPFASSTYVGPTDIARGAAATEESSPKTWIVWVSIPLFLLVVLIFVINGTNSVKIADTPTTPQRVFVSMTLNTNPQGAHIRVNGEARKETTPLTIRARIGTKLLIQIYKKDYKPITFQWIAIKTDQRQFDLESTKPPTPKIVAKVTPKPTPRKVKKIRRIRRSAPRKRPRTPSFPSAVLSIQTIPSHAKVFIGGHLWPGRTPLKVRLRKGEEVKVTIRKYGHYDASFRWKAERDELKKITLYRLSWYNP